MRFHCIFLAHFVVLWLSTFTSACINVKKERREGEEREKEESKKKDKERQINTCMFTY